MSLNWDSHIYAIDTLTGGLCFIVFVIAYLFPPKSINSTYGYRSRRSMESQKNWDFSQKYSTKRMLLSTALLVLTGLLGLFVDLSEGLEVTVGILLLLIALFYPIYLTEKALKRINHEASNSD